MLQFCRLCRHCAGTIRHRPAYPGRAAVERRQNDLRSPQNKIVVTGVFHPLSVWRRRTKTRAVVCHPAAAPSRYRRCLRNAPASYVKPLGLPTWRRGQSLLSP